MEAIGDAVCLNVRTELLPVALYIHDVQHEIGLTEGFLPYALSTYALIRAHQEDRHRELETTLHTLMPAANGTEPAEADGMSVVLLEPCVVVPWPVISGE